MKTFYIIGVGGRTGAMFARELQGACNVVGVGFGDEIEKIKSQKIKIVRGNNAPEALSVKTITPDEFARSIQINPPDFLWLAARNPVNKIVEFYYRHFVGAKNLPTLVLSQNGLSAINDARKGLSAAMGHLANNVSIIRVSLINGIDMRIDELPSRELPPSLKLRTAKTANQGSPSHEAMADQGSPSHEAMADQGGTSVIDYKLPIKLGFGAVKFTEVRPMQTYIGATYANLKEVFQEAGVKAQEFKGREVLAMENSKLFLNLIGMAAAVEGVDAAAGWRDKKIFKKEIAMLGEFAAAVKKNGGGFVSGLGGYPVGIFAGMTLLPAGMLLPFRGLFANVVAKGRNRPKDLSEIDYYNGEVVRLGKEVGVATPANEEIVQKSKVKSQNFNSKVIK